jgi:hypothetical protein
MRMTVIAALLLIPAAPALAQDNERVLTIFGTDKCPSDTICVRAPESERYRIPKNLRESGVVSPQNQSWAERGKSVSSAGAASGIGSCTPSGPGGWTGCWAEQMRAARAEKAQAAQENGPED